MNLTLVWCFLLGVCELIHLCVRRKPALILLNMLTATMEKLDTQVTWHMGFLAVLQYGPKIQEIWNYIILGTHIQLGEL